MVGRYEWAKGKRDFKYYPKYQYLGQKKGVAVFKRGNRMVTFSPANRFSMVHKVIFVKPLEMLKK